MSADAALVDELMLSMEENEISRHIALQILPWFGVVEGNKWAVDVASVTQEIGLSILRSYHVGITANSLRDLIVYLARKYPPGGFHVGVGECGWRVIRTRRGLAAIRGSCT